MSTFFAVGLWFLCGLGAAGFFRAHDRGTMSYWGKSNNPNWDDIAHYVGIGLAFGPLALFLSFFMTGFWRCGWTLNPCDYTGKDGETYHKHKRPRKAIS